MSQKRLQKEHSWYLKSLPEGFTKLHPIDDDLYHWIAEFTGPDDTPYEHGIFTLDITISTDYPFRCPDIKFITQIANVCVSKSGTMNKKLYFNSPHDTLKDMVVAIRHALINPPIDCMLVSSGRLM